MEQIGTDCDPPILCPIPSPNGVKEVAKLGLGGREGCGGNARLSLLCSLLQSNLRKNWLI